MQLQRLVRTAVLVTCSVILYRYSINLPFFPPFLKYDASEIPVMVGAFAYGPVAGLFLELIKNLLHMILKGGANPVGLSANLSAGALLILGTTLVYRLNVGPRWLCLIAGSFIMGVGMIPLNYYFFLPARGMEGPAAFGQAFYLLPPFNIVKGFISASLGLFFYERLAFLFVMKPSGGYDKQA
jgi:riboflavin transporter FmnP